MGCSAMLFRSAWTRLRLRAYTQVARMRRPPVVTIMGHVDHGKTTLLDYLRKSRVAAGEAGGITQHIGAFSGTLVWTQHVICIDVYCLVRTGAADETVTFLDTPGHAAFSAIRARGAKVTDLIVLVVAAGEGVMGQTKEAIDLALHNDVPLIVAISKCDTIQNGDEHRLEAVKAGLRAAQVFPEEDGGDVQVVPVSGLTGAGVDGLLSAITAQAELMELEADPAAPVVAMLIEARHLRGVGHAATVIVQSGTLHVGSVLVGAEAWCRVKSMRDALGEAIESAPPSTPVEITGWHGDPGREVGVALRQVMEGDAERIVEGNLRVRREVEALDAVRQAEERERVLDGQLWRIIKREAKDPSAAPRHVHTYDEVNVNKDQQNVVSVPVVIKADVTGSVEAITKMLLEMPSGKARVKVISASVGPVCPADMELAKASGAHLVSFNLPPPPPKLVKGLAATRPLLAFDIIYKLMDRVEELLVQAIPPVWRETRLGVAKVLQLFPLSGSESEVVLGCRIDEGTVTRGAGPVLPPSPHGLPPPEYRVRVLKDSMVSASQSPATVRIRSMRHGKKEIASAGKGMECGILLDEDARLVDIQPGDLLEAYQRVPSYDTL